MPQNRRTVALLVGMAAFLVGGITVVSVTSSPGDDQPVAVMSEATPTSQVDARTSPAPPPGEATPSSVPTAEAPQGAVVPPSTQPSQPGGGVPEGEAVHAPRDGDYPRRITWEMVKPQRKKGGNNILVSIATTGRTADEVRQHVSTTTVSSDNEKDGRPALGLGPYDLRHARDAVFITETYSGNELSYSCDPAERLDLRLPLHEGSAWTTTQECSYKQGSETRTTRKELSSRVNGGRTVFALGGVRFVWEITTTDDTTTTTRLFSPELGVDVRIDRAADHGFAAYTSTSELTGLPA